MSNKTIIGSIILIILTLGYIDYTISPKIDYITKDGKQIVVSVDGKQTYRPLTVTDVQEGILTEVENNGY